MSVNFPELEEEILRYWDGIDAFATQLRPTEAGPRFSFYDGPPFGKAPGQLYISMTLLLIFYLLCSYRYGPFTIHCFCFPMQF